MKARFFAILILVIFAAFGAGYYFGYDIGFEEAGKGDKILEDVEVAFGKADLIRVSQPQPNQTVQSPLIIRGEARGYWFFEASFPASIFDANGNELGVAIVQARDEWMTEDFVPFEATLFFSSPQTKTGVIIFKKDNPSGLPENDDLLMVPVKFTIDTAEPDF